LEKLPKIIVSGCFVFERCHVHIHPRAISAAHTVHKHKHKHKHKLPVIKNSPFSNLLSPPRRKKNTQCTQYTHNTHNTHSHQYTHNTQYTNTNTNINTNHKYSFIRWIDDCIMHGPRIFPFCREGQEERLCRSPEQVLPHDLPGYPSRIPHETLPPEKGKGLWDEVAAGAFGTQR
jgi:hypothetical protein